MNKSSSRVIIIISTFSANNHQLVLKWKSGSKINVFWTKQLAWKLVEIFLTCHQIKLMPRKIRCSFDIVDWNTIFFATSVLSFSKCRFYTREQTAFLPLRIYSCMNHHRNKRQSLSSTRHFNLEAKKNSKQKKDGISSANFALRIEFGHTLTQCEEFYALILELLSL